MRVPRLRLLAAASVAAALAGCAGPGGGRLSGEPLAQPEDTEIQILQAGPVDVAATTPPQVVVVPDKPGAGNCKLQVQSVGCLDSTTQVLELLGTGTQVVRDFAK